jgi:hypothetical protein
MLASTSSRLGSVLRLNPLSGYHIFPLFNSNSLSVRTFPLLFVHRFIHYYRGDRATTGQSQWLRLWLSSDNWVDQAQPTNYDKHHAFALKLCQAGAEVNALDEKGNSAFHWACLYWPVHRLKNSLLDLGADVNQSNAQGRTPLDFIADDSLEVAFRRTHWYEDLEAMYLRNREWLREVGGRTAEELNTS